MALLSVVGAANAVVLLGDSFDSKTVGSNNVGQNFEVNNTPLPGPWYTDGTAFATTISSAQAQSGPNSLFIDRLATSGAAWHLGDLNGGAALPYDPAVTKYTYSADFFMASNNSNGGAIGLDLYTAGFARMARLLIRADGAVIATAPNTSGVLSSFVFTNTVTRNSWNSLQITQVMNSATSSTFSFAVNGLAVTSGTSTVSYTLNNAAGVTATDADVQMTNFTVAGAPAVTLSDDYYVDNYRVEAVPEPATMTALGLGAAALLRRRKKA